MNDEKVLDVFEKYEASLNDLFLGKEKLEVGDILNALNTRADVVQARGEGFLRSSSQELRDTADTFLTIAVPAIKRLENRLKEVGIEGLEPDEKMMLNNQLHFMATSDYRGDKDAAERLRTSLDLVPPKE